MSYILPVLGTHGWDDTDTPRWWKAGSPFVLFMGKHGIELVAAGEDPFIWDGDLDGVPWLGGRKLLNWKAAGLQLRRYCKPGPTGSPEGAHYVPYESRRLIAHSHGGNVALCAAAAGLRIHTLITVSTPVRKDMMAIAERAVPNIGVWWHVASDRSDAVQWLGELFDGAFGIVREHPLAHRNVRVKAVGHSRLLEDPAVFSEWERPRDDAGSLVDLLRK